MSIYLTCFKYNKLCVSNQVVLPQLRRSRFPTLFVILRWRPFCPCRMHGCRYPQRGGGLAVAEDARHRGHICATKAEAEQTTGMTQRRREHGGRSRCWQIDLSVRQRRLSAFTRCSADLDQKLFHSKCNKSSFPCITRMTGDRSLCSVC